MFEKIKIGIMDLLTILLPGGIFLMMSGIDISGVIPGEFKGKFDWAPTAIFVCAMYITGHLIFMIASWLDDIVYAKVTRVYWHNHNRLVAHVIRIKRITERVDDPKLFNAFKWSNAWLIANQPGLYGEVERYMAESKFFRSLVVVFVAIILFQRPWCDCAHSYEPVVYWVIGGLAFFSAIRYITQRKKSIETAYHGVLTTYKLDYPMTTFRDIEPDIAGLDEDNIHVVRRLSNVIFTNDKKVKELNAPFEAANKTVTKDTLRKPIGDKEAHPWKELRFDKRLNAIIKFVYAILLCVIPFFEWMTTAVNRRYFYGRLKMPEQAGGDLKHESTHEPS